MLANLCSKNFLFLLSTEAKIDKESSEDYYANRFQKNVSSLQWGVKMDTGNRIRMDTSKAMGNKNVIFSGCKWIKPAQL